MKEWNHQFKDIRPRINLKKNKLKSIYFLRKKKEWKGGRKSTRDEKWTRPTHGNEWKIIF